MQQSPGEDSDDEPLMTVSDSASASGSVGPSFSAKASGSASVQPPASIPFDPARFAEILQDMFGTPAAGPLPQTIATGAGKKRKSDDLGAKAAEKARIAAEKDAKRAAMLEEREQKKLASSAAKKASHNLALAAKACAVLTPISVELSALKVPAGCPDQIGGPLQNARVAVTDLLKRSSSMVAASKSKNFGTVQMEDLGFSQGELSTLVSDAKSAMKRLVEYMRLVS